MRRSLILVTVLLLLAGAAEAQDKVKVGVLKLSSSAVLFFGVEKGFFKEFGVEPELVFFQAAAPIATALAAGQLEVGATGLTAALYDIVLGGEKLWIVADKGREWPGQTATVFYSNKFAGDKTKAVNFMKGYVKSSRYYHDRHGRLWVADIEKQMTGWQKHGFMKSVLPLEQIVDTSFVEAAVRAVAE